MSATGGRFTRRELAIFVATLAGLFVVVQLLPVGAARTNPPVTAEPPWDSPRTRELFFRSCADCHSNETRWPWYSRVAPASWLVAHDVEEARSHFNVSEWDKPQKDADEAAEEVREGEMPLPRYLPLHPEARLDEATRAELVAGLAATFGEREKKRR
jgi:mono/diheme cytochrome c family protein